MRRFKIIFAFSALAVLAGGTGVAQAGGSTPSTAVHAQGPAATGPQKPGPFPDIYPAGDTYHVPGQRDGVSDFPLSRYPQLKPKQPGVMDWEHYHSLPEIEWWLKTWAYQHPDIVDLVTVGKSFGDHPIYQLTITNKATGKDTDKPGAYFDGGRHSGEITATEAALYDAWTLITNYGKDPRITQLVNEKTIYVRPVPNPDGSEMYRQTAQTDRSTVRPYDQDGNGKLDDDSPEDLNGDGYLTQMRKHVGPGKGNYVIDSRDPTGRVMLRVDQGKGDYLVYSEGLDPDGDGRVGEDGIGGLDLHRNYPYNWRPMAEGTGRGNTQGGAGAYPLSEPETKLVFSFLMDHTNVGVVDSMDTNAWMILRGPSSCEETECVQKGDLKLLKHFDKVGQQLTGYGRAGDTYRAYATQDSFGKVQPGAEPEALYGHGPDWGYFQYGAVWYGDELWNGGKTLTDYDRSGTVDEWEQQRYCEAHGIDYCFQPWTKYQHPTYGEVEIGGKNPKFFSQNPPAELLKPWVVNESAFNLNLTQSLPQVKVVKSKVKKLSGKSPDGATHELRVTVENQGLIPTALEQAKQVKIVRPDTIRVTLPTGTGQVIGSAPAFYLKGHQQTTVTVRLQLGTDTLPGGATVSVLSTRGGVDTQQLR